MRRYWLPPDTDVSHSIVLQDEYFHHICTVCRQDVGHKFELLINGIAYLVQIENKTKKMAHVKVLEQRTLPELPKPHIELALSLPKFGTFEAVIEKCVELGVKRIRPFYSDYSYLRGDNKAIDSKKSRWDKIVLQATQQSGRGDIMTIDHPVELNHLMEEFQKGGDSLKGVFAFEGQTAHSISEIKSLNLEKTQSVWVFVGSEGGFSVEEVQYFQKFNLLPMTLGQQVLRVETACVTLVAVLKYQLGQMR